MRSEYSVVFVKIYFFAYFILQSWLWGPGIEIHRDVEWCKQIWW